MASQVLVSCASVQNVAAFAVYVDPAFPFGNAQILLTAGAAVQPIAFTLRKTILRCRKAALPSGQYLHKGQIFGLTPGMIAGKCPDH